MDELNIDRRQDDEHGYHAHVTDADGKVWEVIVGPRGGHWVGEAGTEPRGARRFGGASRDEVIESVLQHIRDQQSAQ
jgi:hypothetical protein